MTWEFPGTQAFSMTYDSMHIEDVFAAVTKVRLAGMPLQSPARVVIELIASTSLQEHT